MSLSDLNSAILAFIVVYGAWALGLVVLLAALGLPLPSSVFVIAGGAFVQQGVLDLATTLGVTLLFAVAGDALGYGIGRFLGTHLERRWGTREGWRHAEAAFQRWGGLAIYFSRWLVTALAVPTNWLAGASRYSFRRFIALALAGELIWLLAYGGLGYAFGSQWQTIGTLLGDFSGLVAGLVLAGAGLYWLRWLNRPTGAIGRRRDPGGGTSTATG